MRYPVHRGVIEVLGDKKLFLFLVFLVELELVFLEQKFEAGNWVLKAVFECYVEGKGKFQLLLKIVENLLLLDAYVEQDTLE